ncbi:MAG: hypothetical protein H7Y04_03955 [Verrucomicrobia bacterium]|nr:hypothetical protein [Cytophagales bacterium]
MDNSPKNTNLPEDEIDLIALAQKTGQLIKRNVWLILLGMGFGTAVGYGLFLALPSRYNTYMIARSVVSTTAEVVNITATWNEILEKKEYKLLAEKLYLNPQTVSKVFSISAEPKRIASRDIEGEEGFIIKVTLRDMSITDSLQIGIIKALQYSPYVNLRVTLKKKQLLELKAKIAQELDDLDSTKLLVQQLLISGSIRHNAFLTDPGTLYEQSMKLYEKRQEVENKLQFIDDVQVVESFVKFTEPDFPKIKEFLLLGMLSGFLLTLLLIFFREVKLI